MGQGILSTATASKDGITVNYERFTRISSPLAVRIELKERDSNTVDLWINRNYLEESVEIQEITPEPLRVRSDAGRIIYTILTSPEKPVAIQISMQAQEIGFTEGEIGLLGGRSVKFNQFVYP